MTWKLVIGTERALMQVGKFKTGFTLGRTPMTRLQLLLILLLAVAVPFAAADTIQFNHNNLGISGSIGSVTLTQNGANVDVVLQANPGFSFKLSGGDIMFDTSATLTAGNITNFMADGHAVTGFGFGPRHGFTYDISNLKGSFPKGWVSANQISFTITGINLSQLQPYKWGVHFCTASGNNCGPMTGFASNGGTVPEPGTLSLLGTGLVGLAGLLRRRWIS